MGLDLVYVHVEAPDESGHAGDVECKVEAIENIDRHILGYLMDNLKPGARTSPSCCCRITPPQ